MDVPSLIYLSYANAKELNYENRDQCPDIYDRVVEESRCKIKKTLRKHMGRIILNTIHLMKTKDMATVINIIFPSMSNYDKSTWRIAMYYGVSSWIIYEKDSERMKDVMDIVDINVSYNDTITRTRVDDKLQIIDTAIHDPNCDTDIWMYIEAFNAIGKNLFPKNY